MKLVENLVNPRQGVNGTLHLTATHLIFVDPGGAKETWVWVIVFKTFLVFTTLAKVLFQHKASEYFSYNLLQNILY